MAKREKMSGTQRRTAQQQEKRNRRLSGILIGVALAAVFVYILWQQTVGSPTLSAIDVPDPVLGAADAPIEIVEYGDFGCPACRGWHNAGILAQVEQAYGEKVRFVWKDFPVVTPYSPKAAEAGHCAASQGKFWEYHDYLYESTTNLRDGGLKAAAAALGLNQTEFDACLDSGQMAGKVQANDNAARRLGIRGTPGFTFNGQVLAGPPSFAQLAQMIDAP
ncbi:MAG: DsbA family protein [Caldilineaceae bacterium]|nr:DsbA family protein [Caldilineaceae bacterium]